MALDLVPVRAKVKASSPAVLLMLSGGLDSAWCLRHYAEQGRRLRTHHVSLHDHEGRGAVEDRAVNRVLKWAEKQGYGHLIEHSTSRVEWGSTGWIPKNYHLWAWWAGAILAAPQHRGITEIALPRHSDAFTSSTGAVLSDRAYAAHIEAIAGRSVTVLTPMLHLTKAQVVADLPPELVKAAWWCRRPEPTGAPCHRCMTCRQVDPALV